MLNTLVKSEEVRFVKSQTLTKSGELVTREVIMHPVRYLDHKQQDQAFREQQSAATNLWAATMSRVVEMWPNADPAPDFKSAQDRAKAMSKAVRKTLPDDGPNVSTIGQYVSSAVMFVALFGTKPAIHSINEETGTPSTLVPRSKAQADNQSARPENKPTPEQQYKRAMGAVKGAIGRTISLGQMGKLEVADADAIRTLLTMSADLLGCRTQVDIWLRSSMKQADSANADDEGNTQDSKAA
jgi:hypothetical protein